MELAKRELPYQMRAYEQLMSRYEKLLFSVCLRLLGNRLDAEDVAQDVMLKVFGSIQKFEERAMFKTWLLRIARNECIDRQRRQAVSRRYMEAARNEPVVYEDAGVEDDPVTALLDRMDQSDREVLTLRYVADFSLQEVADIVGIGLSATKMRLYRATDRLRELADAEGIEA